MVSVDRALLTLRNWAMEVAMKEMDTKSILIVSHERNQRNARTVKLGLQDEDGYARSCRGVASCSWCTWSINHHQSINQFVIPLDFLYFRKRKLLVIVRRVFSVFHSCLISQIIISSSWALAPPVKRKSADSAQVERKAVTPVRHSVKWLPSTNQYCVFAFSVRVWAVFDPFFNTFTEISNVWHTTTPTTFSAPVHNFLVINFSLWVICLVNTIGNTPICVVNGLPPQMHLYRWG